MKPELKKDIKEWIEIIALTAVGSLVVFHLNGAFKSDKDKENTQEPTTTEISKPAVNNDTITQHILQKTKQLKR